MSLKAVRGMNDIFGEELATWQGVEKRVRECLENFGYTEFRTPVLEEVEVFSQAVGADTDIVEKQMYYVGDQNSGQLVMRPEGTAAFIRAIIEHQLHRSGQPQRYYYYLPMFRHERPQKGRLRQFHQFGAEFICDPSPEADAELIILLDHIYRSLGISEYVIELNSLGDSDTRARYRDALQDYFRPFLADLDEQSQKRFERAPMRILDSKNEKTQEICANAPKILEFLNNDQKAHFDAVRERLSESGVAFTTNPSIVRGLDYYCRTAFEFTSSLLGAQSALGGGGRYDGLSERFGVPSFPAIGWALGMERLLMVLEEKKISLKNDQSPFFYFAPLGAAAFDILYPLCMELRKKGIPVLMNFSKEKKLKGLMKDAAKSGANFALMLGDDEISSSIATLKNLETREQESISLENISSILSGRYQS